MSKSPLIPEYLSINFSNKFVKSGSSSSDILLGDGSTTNISRISTLETKTQNISSATNSASTNMSKPIHLTTNGECLRMIGTNGLISSYDSSTNTRDWYIGTADSSTKNLTIVNEKTGQIVMYSGNNGITSNSGNKQ